MIENVGKVSLFGLTGVDNIFVSSFNICHKDDSLFGYEFLLDVILPDSIYSKVKPFVIRHFD